VRSSLTVTAPPFLPATHRWLLTLLVGAFVMDVLITLGTGREAVGALPGGALMVACAMLGTRKPGEGAFAGVLVVAASTIFIRINHMTPASLGIDNLLLSEMAAGITLVVLVIWRARPLVSVVCTVFLVGAAMVATLERTPDSRTSSEFRSMQLGLLMLVGAIVVGVYLRSTNRRRAETEMSSLVRRQWPLAAALCLIMFFDVNAANGVIIHILALSGALVASVCAFFAPRAPTTLALTATIAIALSPLLLFLAGDILPGGRSGQTLVLTEVAASMALIAFVTRWSPPWPAGLSTAALATANLLALVLREEHSRGRVSSRVAELGLWLGLLLVVAIATGLYFRSRDRERSQTISVAVTGAQQSERMALARELHDVVAHHVTGIVVQAQAARMVSERDPQIAVRALEKIETSGVEALKAMRFLVASMRGARPAGISEATEQATTDLAADLHTLVEHFSGPPVELNLQFEGTMPQEVGRSVLRLVQESLTNVGKHALGAKSVQIQVVAGHDDLHVRVSDDGVARRADPVGGSGGYGLVGMRERVELLGGRFAAGPAQPVGWRVDAWLPVPREQQEEDT
jgi:signal transduction histidine kinase